MSEEWSRPWQADVEGDLEHLGWTATSAIFQAQGTGNRALEDYMLMMNYHQVVNHDTNDVETLIEYVIASHNEIVEDLERAGGDQRTRYLARRDC